MYSFTQIRVVCSIIFLSFNIIYSSGNSASIPQPTIFRIPGLSCSLPIALGNVVHNFNAAKSDPCLRTKAPQRVILHGPPGNGKSTVPAHIATLTNSELIFLTATQLVDKYQNSGANKIDALFEHIREKLASSDKGVILCIDEIDALAVKDADKNKDLENTLRALWTHLSKIESMPDFLFICTANSLENIPKAFLNRFLRGASIIDVPNPNAQQRKDLIQDYFAAYDAPQYNIIGISKPLVLLTKKMSTEFTIQLTHDISATEHALHYLDKEVKLFHTKTTVATAQDHIEKLIKDVTHAQEALLEKFQKEHSRLTAHTTNSDTQKTDLASALLLMKKYISNINYYCTKARTYINTPNTFILPEPHLNLLVKETDGCSMRMLTQLTERIYTTAKTSNTKDIAWQAIIEPFLKETKIQITMENKEAAEKKALERDKQIRRQLNEHDNYLKKYSLIGIRDQHTKECNQKQDKKILEKLVAADNVKRHTFNMQLNNYLDNCSI